jgi:hypothetical protein
MLWQACLSYQIYRTYSTKMLLITSLGDVAIGLMWGWLLGQFSEAGTRSPVNIYSLAASSVLIASEIFLFSDVYGLMLYIGTAALALLLRVAWYQELKKRFGSSR